MRPIRSILDASFRYVPSVATSVASTWRRAGWRPTTDEERKARRQPTAELVIAGDRDGRVAIEHRKTQSADRNVQDAGSAAAYRNAIVSPL
jgi:hypothetical protein